MDFLILIPPSEGKQEEGKHSPLKQLSQITTQLLEEAETTDKTKLYKSRTQEAITLNNQVATSPTMKAINRYTGVMYTAIDYETLTNKQYFDTRVRIISGLFGILKATDHIPNYKFPIQLLSAAKKWHDTISSEIQETYVINLLPNTHKKAVTYQNGIEITFSREKNGKTIKAGHAGKTIKGRFIRWLCENNITEIKDIKTFCEDGYAWNGTSFHKK